MMFEQELYTNFSIYLPRSYFLTFAGDVSFLFTPFHIYFEFLIIYLVHTLYTLKSERSPEVKP